MTLLSSGGKKIFIVEVKSSAGSRDVDKFIESIRKIERSNIKFTVVVSVMETTIRFTEFWQVQGSKIGPRVEEFIRIEKQKIEISNSLGKQRDTP